MKSTGKTETTRRERRKERPSCLSPSSSPECEEHKLLRRLLEQCQCPLSVDESVSQYVVQALTAKETCHAPQGEGEVTEDVLSFAEKKEFLREMLLETSTWEDKALEEFLQDLLKAGRELHGSSQDSEFENCQKSFRERATRLTEDGEEVESMLKRSTSTQCESQTKTEQKSNNRKDAAESKNNNEASNQMKIEPYVSHVPSRNDDDKARTLYPLKKCISKYLTQELFAELDDDIVSYVYEACIDRLESLEDKASAIFSFISELRQGNRDEPITDDEKFSVTRDIVGVCLHLERKLAKKSQHESSLSSPVAQEAQTRSEPPAPDDVSELHDIFPSIDLRIIQYVYDVMCSKDKNQTAQFLLENVDEESLKKISKQQEEFMRKKKSIDKARETVQTQRDISQEKAEPPASEVSELRAMFPHVELKIVQYVYDCKCFKDKNQTAQFLLENSDGELLQRLVMQQEEYMRKKKAINKEKAEREAEEMQRVNSTIFERYGETEMTHAEYVRAVSKNAVASEVRHSKHKDSGKSKERRGVFNKTYKQSPLEKVRYRDGVVATYTGEKAIIVRNPKDDYDGGSRGTVKTKGKRGPGFIKT